MLAEFALAGFVLELGLSLWLVWRLRRAERQIAALRLAVVAIGTQGCDD